MGEVFYETLMLSCTFFVDVFTESRKCSHLKSIVTQYDKPSSLSGILRSFVRIFHMRGGDESSSVYCNDLT